jgi:hypothetical protein
MIFFESIKGRLTFSLVAGLMVMYLFSGVAFTKSANHFSRASLMMSLPHG